MSVFNPRFYLSLGLVSILTSALLLATFLGMIPERKADLQGTRSELAESVASGSSILLQRNDFSGIRANLQFAVERSGDLDYASVTRFADGSKVDFGEKAVSTDYTRSKLSVPIFRNDREWGMVDFYFRPLEGQGWKQRLQRSNLALILFILAFSFVGFYFYLGKMLKQLNPSEAVPSRVRSALDTIAESLIVMNKKGEIVLANVAFAELVEKSPEALIGVEADSFDWQLSNLPDARPGDEPDFPWLTTLRTGLPVKGAMISLLTGDGTRHSFIVNCSPIGAQAGRVGGVLVSLDDITLLEQKEVELLRSKEEAEYANRAKSEFLSNMSHEIRTPMTAILGFTEVLKRGYSRDTESTIKHLDTIDRSGKHLLELINDILDLSKVESGALEVESIACEPHLIVHDVVQVLKVKAEQKDIYLKAEYPSQLPETINSDPSRLRQIITNLAGNAIKFTDSGGVSIALSIEEKQDSSFLTIDVRDTGIGMTEAQQAGIFEAFVQADTTITRRFGGTGLGLSISKNLAEALGGKISVSSTPGKGSTFSVTVSAGDLSDVAWLGRDEIIQQTESVAASKKDSWNISGKRVLVVDDAQENRDLLELILTDMQIEVHTAENGQLALDALRELDADLVLMDIQMPVMDGYVAVAEMRKRAFEKPVVALTANAMKGFEERVFNAGFSHYMTKPIDISKLTALLAELLDGTRVSDQSSDDTVLSAPERTAESLQPAELIPNTLVQKNPRFREVAVQFLERLEARLHEMRDCLLASDFEELAKHAHWLKGSGGSVGFGALTEPAVNLETQAKASSADGCELALAEIDTLLPRLVCEGTVTKNPTHVAQPPEHQSGALGVASNAASPITSSLLQSNEKFRDIVERFIPKLEESVSSMRDSLDASDFARLASLAHWLKGSGGNVGFHDFTEPARELELVANDENSEAASSCLNQIEALLSRIEITPAESDVLKKSA